MAVKEDYEACADRFVEWANRFTPSTIIALSADTNQIKILSTVYPKSNIHNLGIREWNLSSPSDRKVDLIVACNVFHYSSTPLLWFSNVFACCKEFWMQDLYKRKRGEHTEYGADGDCMRYCLGNEGSAAFDLLVYEYRLLDYYLYDAGSFANKRPMINFVARFKGDPA